FESVRRISTYLKEGKALLIRVQIGGNTLFDTVTSGGEFDGLEKVMKGFDFLHKIRVVADRLNLNPPLPDLRTVPVKQLNAIVVMYELLQGRPVYARAPQFRATLTISEAVDDIDVEATHVFEGITRTLKFDFFETPVELGMIQCKVTVTKIAGLTRLPN